MNIMNKLLLLVALMVTPLFTFSQDHCGTTEYMKSLTDADSTYAERLEQMNQEISEFEMPSDRSNYTLTIPVIVNVILPKSLMPMITDALIIDQIDALNRDFNLLNADTVKLFDRFANLAADMKVEFCLSTVDVDGNTMDPIRRKKIAPPFSFNYWNNNIKFTAQGGLDAYYPDRYMNIWVGDLSGGLLGYSQFPNGDSITDGNVVDYSVFGTYGGHLRPNYANGRVLVHEVGHWLNLRHVWGDCVCCDDFVDDTPEQSGPHYAGDGCGPFYTCNTLDLVMNYMDYSGDECMVMFTKGQKERAWASIMLHRSKYVEENCGNPYVSASEMKPLASMKVYPTLTNGNITVEFDKIITNLNISIHDSRGVAVNSSINNHVQRLTFDLNGLSDGMYIMNVNADGELITKKIIITRSGNNPFGSSLMVIEIKIED